MAMGVLLLGDVGLGVVALSLQRGHCGGDTRGRGRHMVTPTLGQSSPA